MVESGDMTVPATRVPVSPLTGSDGAASTAPPSVNELVIEPRRGWIAVDWRELWRSRELLYFLIWRDIKGRYKQAVLGVGWAGLPPARSGEHTSELQSPCKLGCRLLL